MAEVIPYRVKGYDHLPTRLDAVYPGPKYLLRVGYIGPGGLRSRRYSRGGNAPNMNTIKSMLAVIKVFWYRGSVSMHAFFAYLGYHHDQTQNCVRAEKRKGKIRGEGERALNC